MRRFTETNTGTRPKRGAKSARFWRRSTTQSVFTPLSATCLRRSSKTSSERLREYRDESDPAFFQAWRNLSADVFLLTGNQDSAVNQAQSRHRLSFRLRRASHVRHGPPMRHAGYPDAKCPTGNTDPHNWATVPLDD